MDAIIRHGDFSTPFEIESPRLSVRSDDLDTLTLTYCAPNENAFHKGQAAPGWAGFIIDDYTAEPDTSEEWIFTLNCVGIHDAQARRVKGGYKETGRVGEFDSYEDRWLTFNKGYFRKGARFGNFVCVEASSVEKYPGLNLWECSGSFYGLTSGQGERRRVCSINEEQVSEDQMIVALEGGWNTFRKGKASLPKIVVTDTFPSLSPPPTNRTPGNATPPATPATRRITYSGASVRWNWPSGWTYKPTFEQPFGINVSLYMVTEIYEFVNQTSPG